MTDGLTERDRKGILSVLEAFPKISRAVLFGSRAIGTFRGASDLDLALEGDDLKLADLVTVRSRIGRLELPFEADIVIRSKITNRDVEKHIREYGQVFYERKTTAGSEWPSMVLKDLLLITKDGEWGKGEPADGLSAMTVIRGADFSDVRLGRLDEAPTRYIPTHIAERKKLQPTDILIETAGGTRDQPTGRTVFLKPRLFETHLRPLTCASFSRFLRVKPELVHPEFVYWYLQSLYAAGEMEQHQIQHTGVARFQYTKFAETTRVPIPPLPEQRAIASVLGALDDKIELNRRMNETLEALAQTLFKSWFVDATQSALPKGWREGSILEVAKLLSGGTPKTEREDYWNGDILWASAKDVSQCGQTFLVTTERTITKKGLEESATQLIPAFCTVVVARGATTGRMTMFGREIAMNQTCYALASTTGTPFALYCLFRHAIDALVQTAHGSVFDTITTSTFAASKVVLPPQQVFDAFEKTVSPIFTRILSNIEESRTLAALRDALLPKLLSGELRVPTDAQFVEVEV